MNSWYEKGYLMQDFASLKQSDAQARFDKQQLAAIGDSVDATFSRVTEFVPSNAPYMRKEADSVVGSNLANWPVDVDKCMGNSDILYLQQSGSGGRVYELRLHL